jgi:hypothetical protein
VKHKLKRLGARTYKWDKDGKMVEITHAEEAVMERAHKAFKGHIFKEEWYEHIADHPIFIRSKKQLREECEKRGMIAKALD